MNTSIKFKRLLVSPVGEDGGMGNRFVNFADGAREGTAQFQGSSADSTSHKNISGETLDTTRLKGDMTMNWQTADMNPNAMKIVTAGRVTNTEDFIGWQPPADENAAVYVSVQILSANNIVYNLPRVSMDAFPNVNDDDLHYFTVEGSVLKPSLRGLPSFDYKVLTPVGAAKKQIIGFKIEGSDAVAVIDESTKSITIEVTGEKTQLIPLIECNLGAYADGGGFPTDFTDPVKYVVVAADGSEQEYTVTVTTV